MTNQFKIKLKKSTALNRIAGYIKQHPQLLAIPVLAVAGYFEVELPLCLFVLSGFWSSGGALTTARMNLAG